MLAPLIYISGPDGSGKTTVINELRKILDDSEVNYHYTYSLRLAIRAFFKRLSSLLKAIGLRSNSANSIGRYHPPDLLFLTEDHNDRDNGTRVWRSRKVIALIFGIFDTWIGWLIILPIRLAGKCVIVENSPHDTFVKYHMPRFKSIDLILGPTIPRPTAGFLLRADSQVIVARKPELTATEIDHYYERIEIVIRLCGALEKYESLKTDHQPTKTARVVFDRICSLL
jgi:hypothetical protein